jgi:TolB-like protein/Tfp pilus assembly protein PilF
MAQKSNNLERFWRELKRRKVVHVITVYAAVAFVILQLVDMVSQPLHFPEWTQGFIIVLLCIGFVIAIFLSWIYDITPAGVKKTKPVSAIKHSDQATAPTSSGWKIATYISSVVIIALIAFNFISRRNLSTDISKLEKSIAVIPFRNESTDTTNAYFINGIMERITTNLQMIKEFRVIGRTSVEQYRNNKTKSIPEIAKELGVSFIIEGSGQKYGNSFSLVVQLLKAKGKENHLWAHTYDQEIKEVNDYIRIESEIAQSIATELKAVITTEEKQLIEKPPTGNLTAYDFYQRGREEYAKYVIDNTKRTELERADFLYHEALKYDSTFAQAYTGLASVYWEKHFWESYLSENLLDSVLILSNIALSYDNQLSEAYTIRGNYYGSLENKEQAIKEYDRAIKLNPNDAMAYFRKGEMYIDYDLVKSIDNLLKAASRYRGSLLPSLLRQIGYVLLQAGFVDKDKEYSQEAFKLDGDSMQNYKSLANIEFCSENYKMAVEYLGKAYKMDSSNRNIQWLLGHHNVFFGQYKESLKYFKKWLEGSLPLSEANLFGMHRVGWAYWKNGDKEKADYYFNEQIKYCNRMKELGRVYGINARIFYDLAGVYAFRGDKAKAYENLRNSYNQEQALLLWGVSSIKHDPLFDSIRKEPEFQQMLRDVEAKYQAEHERAKKWLEEQGMLN